MEDFNQVTQAQIKSASIDREIIHKNLHDILHIVGENGKHTHLGGSQTIVKPKWHSTICKSPIGACKSGFLLVTWVDRILEESRVSIQVTKEIMLD